MKNAVTNENEMTGADENMFDPNRDHTITLSPEASDGLKAAIATIKTRLLNSYGISVIETLEGGTMSDPDTIDGLVDRILAVEKWRHVVHSMQTMLNNGELRLVARAPLPPC